jgi:ribosomal protein S6
LKKYETIVVLDEKNVNNDGADFLAEFEKLLKGEFAGTVIESVNMGRKQFAREMKKRKTGIYLDLVHEMTPDKEILLRDKFKLDNRVLRMQTYNYDRPEQS